MIQGTAQRSAGMYMGPRGLTTSEVKKHRSGMFYRTDVVDLLSIRESFLNYRNVLVTDRIVLDAGANVGAFSWIAGSRGASKVYSFEPEPCTFAMLVKNIELLRQDNVYTLYNRALTHLTTESVNFYVGVGRGAPSMASTIHHRGRARILAKNEHFKTFVDTVRPNTVKMDIEGGEYDIILDIPDSCDELALEWHGATAAKKEKFKQIYPLFLEMGWRVIHEKKREFYKSSARRDGREPNWAIDAHYRR
jgi:FkbM family methyltransferase